MEKQMYRPHWLVDLIFLLKDKISKINMTNIWIQSHLFYSRTLVFQRNLFLKAIHEQEKFENWNNFTYMNQC